MSCGEADKCPGSCLYNFPCCGGFCAPTENPDPSCFRHVSNEWTLPGGAPAGTGPFSKVSDVLETSGCCISVGKLGCACGDKNRRVFMIVGAFFNFVSIILCIVGCLAITTDSGNIEQFHWVKGTTPASAGWTLYVGVTAKYDIIDCASVTDSALCASGLKKNGFTLKEGTKYAKITEWADEKACQSDADPNDTLVGEATKASIRAINTQCAECKKHLLTTSTLIMGIVGTWPSILTNLQRTTRFGDVNCQATAGTIGTLFSVVNNLVALVNFNNACDKNMPQSLVDTHGDTVKIEWSKGPGWICILLGTVIKVFDALCHAIVPTPEARWSKGNRGKNWPKDSQGKECVLEYLKLVDAPQQGAMSEGPKATEMGNKADSE